MSGMGLLGAALAGAAGGVGKGLAENAKQQMADESAMKRMESAEKLRAFYAEQAEVRAEEKAKRQAAQVDTRASEIANAGRNANLDQATQIYKNSGMSDSDIALGLGAVDEARKTPETPTADQRYQAMREGGLLTRAQELDYERNKESDARSLARENKSDTYQRERDAKGDSFKEQELNLRKQQIQNSAALNNLQYKAAKLTYERALEEAKIPASVEKAYKTAEAEYQSLSKTIDAAVAKGEFDRTSGQQLLDRQAKLTDKMQSLLNPYLPDSAKTKQPSLGGLPDGIPPGSKQIGTSGGKPVFQAPNGKRYIVD